jgi:hypothetical protein
MKIKSYNFNVNKILLQKKMVVVALQGYSREGYFCASFCRNPLYKLQQYLDFKF